MHVKEGERERGERAIEINNRYDCWLCCNWKCVCAYTGEHVSVCVCEKEWKSDSNASELSCSCQMCYEYLHTTTKTRLPMCVYAHMIDTKYMHINREEDDGSLSACQLSENETNRNISYTNWFCLIELIGFVVDGKAKIKPKSFSIKPLHNGYDAAAIELSQNIVCAQRRGLCLCDNAIHLKNERRCEWNRNALNIFTHMSIPWKIYRWRKRNRSLAIHI